MKSTENNKRAASTERVIRFQRKRKLVLAAVKFIQRLYMHRPVGITDDMLRRIHMRITTIVNLPYGWTDDDYTRAANTLNKLQKEVYDERYAEFSGPYEDTLAEVMQKLNFKSATLAERANVIAEVLKVCAAELANTYGEEQPPVKFPLFFTLAAQKPPYPDWMPRAVVDFLLQNCKQQECIEISNLLYDRLSNTQTALSALSATQEDELDKEMQCGK